MISDQLDFPQDRYYDKNNHFWVKPEDNTQHLIIGIDEYGLDTLGDLAFLSFHPAGGTVQRGQSIGKLEAAKMTGDLISPISGRILVCNDAVAQNPALVNDDPYGKGWLAVIEPDQWETERAALLSAEEKAAWVSAEQPQQNGLF